MSLQRRHLLLAGCAAGFPAWAAAAETGFDVQHWSRKQPVPQFPMQDQDGKPWSLAALRGRAVLLNFWATWCEPCRAEMPSLQALAAREADRLSVVAINLKESPEAIARFVQATGLQLPVVRDAQGDMARAWGIRIYPSTVLIDDTGRVHSVVRGALDWAGPEGARLLAPLFADQRVRKR
ncbi:TlpA family protein disulfide reductase [Rhodoferax saidenbachensis]|nr:TlpA disulfide reductase family protein [Rhodoferax saidenbachensis]